MSDILRLIICTIAYVILFGGSVCMLAEPATAGEYVGNFERMHAVENRPPQVGTWAEKPTIIVCEHAPVSQSQIGSAVAFWKRLGYKFAPTQYKNDQLNKCEDPDPEGYIILHLVTEGVKMEDSAVAQTHFYVDTDTHTIKWAIIYIRDINRPTVLEHELGHALGFLHYNHVNHLMNAKLVQGGWGTEGLENSQK